MCNNGGCQSGARCGHNAQCNGTCVCNAGHEGDGFSCNDIDECAGGNGCGQGMDCTNNPGSFSCACSANMWDCHNNLGDGCEVDTGGSNRGFCGNNCAVNNANAVCNAGICGIGNCGGGFADCGGMLATVAKLKSTTMSRNGRRRMFGVGE